MEPMEKDEAVYEEGDDRLKISLILFEPQKKFKNVVKAYSKLDKLRYYELTDIEPESVIVLKQPIGELPAGAKLLMVSGAPEFHTVGGVFAGYLKCWGKWSVKFIPVEEVLNGDNMEGIEFCTPVFSENEYMKRYGWRHYALRLLQRHDRC